VSVLRGTSKSTDSECTDAPREETRTMGELTNEGVKALVKECGADLCGIASIDGFAAAPAGFHPRDIFESTRSVVAFAIRMPDSVFASANPVPYTFMTTQVLNGVSRISYDLARRLGDMGVTAVPAPSEPYEFWDADTMTGKGILSLRHIAELAGMGTILRNQLLTNRRYGNRIALGAVLVDADITPDPICDHPRCPPRCNVCRDLCPAGAISDEGVNQKLCRSVAQVVNEKGYHLYKCRTCREKCPLSKGKGAGEPHE
jgi:epoxyqueuosine reductase